MFSILLSQKSFNYISISKLWEKRSNRLSKHYLLTFLMELLSIDTNGNILDEFYIF